MERVRSFLTRVANVSFLGGNPLCETQWQGAGRPRAGKQTNSDKEGLFSQGKTKVYLAEKKMLVEGLENKGSGADKVSLFRWKLTFLASGKGAPRNKLFERLVSAMGKKCFQGRTSHFVSFLGTCSQTSPASQLTPLASPAIPPSRLAVVKLSFAKLRVMRRVTFPLAPFLRQRLRPDRHPTQRPS